MGAEQNQTKLLQPTNDSCVSTCWHGLITCINVTGPAKIDHVSANYTELYFANIFRFECAIPFP